MLVDVTFRHILQTSLGERRVDWCSAPINSLEHGVVVQTAWLITDYGLGSQYEDSPAKDLGHESRDLDLSQLR